MEPIEVIKAALTAEAAELCRQLPEGSPLNEDTQIQWQKTHAMQDHRVLKVVAGAWALEFDPEDRKWAHDGANHGYKHILALAEVWPSLARKMLRMARRHDKEVKRLAKRYTPRSFLVSKPRFSWFHAIAIMMLALAALAAIPLAVNATKKFQCRSHLIEWANETTEPVDP